MVEWRVPKGPAATARLNEIHCVPLLHVGAYFRMLVSKAVETCLTEGLVTISALGVLQSLERRQNTESPDFL